MADLNNVTGAFSGNWYPSNAAGTPSSVVAVSDDDGSMTTVPPALDNYTITGTYTQALAGGGNAPGNILKENSTKTGCDAGASSSYDFDRTVVLNMTEGVSAPADLAAFKAQTGVCGQTNIVSGSELDNSSTGITKVSGPSSGFNNDHLLLTFGDWRTIDDSNHFTSNTEAGIANSAFDGSSGNDLMQIVSVQDASGLAATAGNGRGVLIVDATPALATKMTASGSTAGSSLTIGFDQTISTGDNGEDDNNRAADEDTEFEIQGDGVNYTFDFTDNDGVGAANPASGSNAWTVTRSTDYVDRFGNVVSADNRLDITLAATTNTDSNVPGGMANSLFTITMVDPSTSTGDNDADTDGGAATTDADNVDYTDFFAELSHASAASAAATSGTTPSFYLDYRDLEDNSFNSWRNVETFDQYDGTNEPRLVGADSTVPRLQTVAYANMDVDATFLLQDTSGIISLSAAHASAAGDPDIIYTPGTDTSYIGGATEDASVNNLWGYSATVANGESNASRLVFKFAVPSGAAVDMTQALAFIYLPTNEQVSDTANIANVVVTTTALTAGGFGRESAGGLAGSVGQVDSDGDAAYTDEVNVVVELPDYEVSKAVNIASTDLLVLQNLIINDVSYSVHINAPAISTAAPNASETAHGLTTTVYRHVFLDNSDMVGNNNGTAGAAGIQVGASFTSAAPRFSGELTFREELAAATTANVVFSTTNAVDDDTAAFNGTTTTTDEVVSLSTTAGAAEVTDNSITFTLDALSAGSVTETLSKVVGRNSVLTVTAKDHSTNESTTTITLRKGHGQLTVNAGGGAQADIVLLNTISGNSIDNL
jgi:hypothetical protein